MDRNVIGVSRQTLENYVCDGARMCLLAGAGVFLIILYSISADNCAHRNPAFTCHCCKWASQVRRKEDFSFRNWENESSDSMS